MLEELIGELLPMWNWLLTQLGWEGIQLSWVHFLFLALALVGALIVLRNLIGGRSGGGGGGSYGVAPPSGRQGGLPTRYYTGDPRLGDFSIPPGVYDFKVPSPTPDLSGLRGPVKMDLNKARELFVPAGRRHSDSLKRNTEGEIPGLNLPAGSGVEEERSIAANSSGTSQPAAPTSSKPNWELAKKLFIPSFRR